MIRVIEIIVDLVIVDLVIEVIIEVIIRAIIRPLVVRPILPMADTAIPIVEMIETVETVETIETIMAVKPRPFSEPRAKAPPEPALEAERIAEEPVAEVPVPEATGATGVTEATERPAERAPERLPMEGLYDDSALIALSEDQGLSLGGGAEAQDQKSYRNA